LQKLKSSCFSQIEMEQCECLPLSSKFAWISVRVKTKPFNRQTVISIDILFKVLSAGRNTYPQPWPPLINPLVDAVLELSSAFKFLQGSVATFSLKLENFILLCGSFIQHTAYQFFYQDLSSIVEVMTKIFGVFMPHSVYSLWVCVFLCLTVYVCRWLLQRLHAVHTGFHSDLVRSCTLPRDGATTGNITIADCFITWKEKLLVYGEFCSNLPRAQKLLDELCEAKPVIGERVTVSPLAASRH